MGLKADFSSFIALEKRIQETKANIDGWEARNIDVRGKDITVEDAEQVLEAKQGIGREERELGILEQKLEKLENTLTANLQVLQAKSISVSLEHFGNFTLNIKLEEETDDNGDPYTAIKLKYSKF